MSNFKKNYKYSCTESERALKTFKAIWRFFFISKSTQNCRFNEVENFYLTPSIVSTNLWRFLLHRNDKVKNQSLYYA
jgi:hypothetical protein